MAQKSVLPSTINYCIALSRKDRTMHDPDSSGQLGLIIPLAIVEYAIAISAGVLLRAYLQQYVSRFTVVSRGVVLHRDIRPFDMPHHPRDRGTSCQPHLDLAQTLPENGFRSKIAGSVHSRVSPGDLNQ